MSCGVTQEVEGVYVTQTTSLFDPLKVGTYRPIPLKSQWLGVSQLEYAHIHLVVAA